MNSLTKDRRIRKNNEYQLVYKHGRYEVGRLCVVYHMSTTFDERSVSFAST